MAQENLTDVFVMGMILGFVTFVIYAALRSRRAGKENKGQDETKGGD